jgi:hypothetical protein
MSLSRAPSARKLTESILKDRERRSQAQTLTPTRARDRQLRSVLRLTLARRRRRLSGLSCARASTVSTFTASAAPVSSSPLACATATPAWPCRPESAATSPRLPAGCASAPAATSASRNGAAPVRTASASGPNYWHRPLLRERRERPRDCRAAEQRDERATPHSITSSARTKIDGGTVRPSALAVLPFTAISNFT